MNTIVMELVSVIGMVLSAWLIVKVTERNKP